MFPNCFIDKLNEWNHHSTLNKRITYAAIPSVSMVSSFARAVVWTLGIITKSIRTAIVGSLSAFIYIWKKEDRQSALLTRLRIELCVVVLFSFVSFFCVLLFLLLLLLSFFNHNIYAISINKLTNKLSLPSHSFLSPKNPCLQVHWYDPKVLWQEASTLQYGTADVHSSISRKKSFLSI